MSPWFKHHAEKLLVVAAAGVLACSIFCTARLSLEIPRLGGTGGDAGARMLDDYVPVAWRIPAAEPTVWSAAAEQSAGKAWRYDLFTPPAIYYDPRSRRFVVTPLAGPVAETDESAGAEETDDEPFPLQLAGYFGSPDDYVLAFVVTESTDVVMSRVGRHLDEWGLTIKSFEVKTVPVARDEPWPVYEVAGFATLVDEQMGTEVILDTRSSKTAATAVTALNSPPSHTREGATHGP